MGLNETLYKLENGNDDSPEAQKYALITAILLLVIGIFWLIPGVATLCTREKLPATVTSIELVGSGRGAISFVHLSFDYQGEHYDRSIEPIGIPPYIEGQKTHVYIEPYDPYTATTACQELTCPVLFTALGVCMLLLYRYLVWKHHKHVMEEARRQVLQYDDIE